MCVFPKWGFEIAKISRIAPCTMVIRVQRWLKALYRIFRIKHAKMVPC